MRVPDFAHTDLRGLAKGDLRFLIERMPQAGGDYREIAALLEHMPSTLESMLTSEYVYRQLVEEQQLVLDVSPFLLFSILLRRSLGPLHTMLERRVVNYLANLLALFARSERLARIEDGGDPRHYVVDLLQGVESAEPHRQFITYAHIGNYTLWLTGLQGPWLEQRYRYGRRPVSPRYYEDFGRAYFDRAAHHRLAREFQLDDVFSRLAFMFEHYRRALEQLRREHMAAA